jgi:hypothetical protein
VHAAQGIRGSAQMILQANIVRHAIVDSP